MSRKHRWLGLTLLLAWSLSHAAVRGQGKDEPRNDRPAEKVRKILDQTMIFDYTGQSLFDVLDHFKEKTKLNVTVDMVTLQQFGIGIDQGNPNPIQVNLKADGNTKVRTALQRLLNSYNLSYAILDDSVLVTTEDIALHRMMRQRVSVNYSETPLAKTIRDLAQTTALNIVIDPRMAKEAQAAVTLQLDDAPLETAIRLLAEVGGMKAVRMGHVLFITNEARADKIRKEEAQAPKPPNMLNPGIPLVEMGGFGGVAPALPALPPAKVDPAPRPKIEN